MHLDLMVESMSHPSLHTSMIHTFSSYILVGKPGQMVSSSEKCTSVIYRILMFHSLSLLHLLYSYIVIHIKLNYCLVLCCLSILAAEGYHVLINVILQDNESEPPNKVYTYKCIEDGVSFSDNNHFARELLVVTTVSSKQDAVSTTMFMEYSFPLSYSSCEKDREFEIQVMLHFFVQ